MIRQTFECNTGILFSTAALAETGLDVPTIWPVYQKTKRPAVGPSPGLVEQYEAGDLPPLRRRSTALGVDGKTSRPSVSTDTSTKDVFMTNGHAYKNEKSLQNGIDKRKTTDSERGDIYNHHVHRQNNTTNGQNSCVMHPDLLPEQVEDHFDALAPVNDMLAIAKGWWVLEYWPVKVRVQRRDSEIWEKVVRLNRGRYRAIREVEPLMHWTVECKRDEGGYKINNPLDRNAVWQVTC